MTLTAIIGALVGVAARPALGLDRLERLAKRVDELSRSQRKLIDHIELLERMLAQEQAMSVHWRAEAQRLARESRERREARENAANAQARHGRHLAQLAQLGQNQESALGYCNCVPSRAQVWGSQSGLVNRLNRAGG